MTALELAVALVWPIVVVAGTLLFLRPWVIRLKVRADQVEATADWVEARKDEVDATARELRSTSISARRDAGKFREWMLGVWNDSRQPDYDDAPTVEMAGVLEFTRDQLIRAGGAPARSPRHRRQGDDEAH